MHVSWLCNSKPKTSGVSNDMVIIMVYQNLFLSICKGILLFLNHFSFNVDLIKLTKCHNPMRIEPVRTCKHKQHVGSVDRNDLTVVGEPHILKNLGPLPDQWNLNLWRIEEKQKGWFGSVLWHQINDSFVLFLSQRLLWSSAIFLLFSRRWNRITTGV